MDKIERVDKRKEKEANLAKKNEIKKPSMMPLDHFPDDCEGEEDSSLLEQTRNRDSKDSKSEISVTSPKATENPPSKPLWSVLPKRKGEILFKIFLLCLGSLLPSVLILGSIVLCTMVFLSIQTDFFSDDNRQELLFYSSILIFCVIIVFIINGFIQHLLISTIAKIVNIFRLKLYCSLLRLPMEYFDKHKDRKIFSKMILSDSKEAIRATILYYILVIEVLVCVIISLSICFYFDAKVGIISLAALPLSLYSTYYVYFYINEQGDLDGNNQNGFINNLLGSQIRLC